MWQQKVISVLVFIILSVYVMLAVIPVKKSSLRLHKGHTLIKKFWPEVDILKQSVTGYQEMIKEAEIAVAVKMKAKTVIFKEECTDINFPTTGYILMLCVSGEHHKVIFQRSHVPAHRVLGWPPLSKEHTLIVSCGDAVIFGNEKNVKLSSGGDNGTWKDHFILLEFSGIVQF